jgi:hypothetical protein
LGRLAALCKLQRHCHRSKSGFSQTFRKDQIFFGSNEISRKRHSAILLPGLADNEKRTSRWPTPTGKFGFSSDRIVLQPIAVEHRVQGRDEQPTQGALVNQQGRHNAPRPRRIDPLDRRPVRSGHRSRHGRNDRGARRAEMHVVAATRRSKQPRGELGQRKGYGFSHWACCCNYCWCRSCCC